MKKEVFKKLVVSLTYCCEGFSNNGKGIFSIAITFACVFCRELLIKGFSNRGGNDDI